MNYDFKLYAVREGIPIGEFKATECTIKFISSAEITRGIQVVISADEMNMYKTYTSIEDFIYFDGSRYFNGTWSFSSSSLYQVNYFQFNMFRDMIRPIVINEDGTEYSFGDFMIVSAPKKINDLDNFYLIEGYDETMKLKQMALTDRLFIAKNTLYLTAINRLLTECGFTNVVSDSSTAKLLIDREYEQGTTYLSIINELLNEINFNKVHMENDNYVYLIKKKDVTTPSFIYSGKNDTVINDIKLDTDIYNLPNVLVGVMSSPDHDTPIIYKTENNDPESIISILNRGYKVVKVYKLSNIPSFNELKAYIDGEKLNAMQATEKVDLKTKFEENHTFENVIQLDIKGLQGIFIEKSWQVNLGANISMNHTLERKKFI